MSKFVQKPSAPEEIEAVQYKGSYQLMREEMNELWGEGASKWIRSTYLEGALVTQLASFREWISLGTDYWVVKRNGYYLPLADEEFRNSFQPMDEEADDALEVSVSHITDETDSEFGDTLGEIDLLEKLTEILNKTKTTEVSGTHDFVLAQYLIRTLDVFEETIKMRAGARRERWQFDTPNEGE